MAILTSDAGTYFHTLYRLLSNVEISDNRNRIFTLDSAVEKIIEAILSVRSKSKKILLIGNGGSAAVVSHMQNDLCASVGVKAMVFHDTPLVTALSNDHGYGSVFAKQVALWAEKGDLLIAISSSGESENIIRALATAHESGCRSITFTGFDHDNTIRFSGDLNIYVPVKSYGLVELAHSVLTHYLTDYAKTIQMGKGRDIVRIVSFEEECLPFPTNGNRDENGVAAKPARSTLLKVTS
ncbi:SIS domain-containing protein [bacterium]|nr:SIS domain-containing protein [bacterium]